VYFPLKALTDWREACPVSDPPDPPLRASPPRISLSNLNIQLHGNAATANAREIMKEMRRKGDYDGADTWPRITVAIGGVGETQ
jgi:hypothetical protein